MRVTRIAATDVPPVKEIELVGLSSPVIIAGANGSGKTRLKEAIAATFRKPARPMVTLDITATRAAEKTAWGGDVLTVAQGEVCAPLSAYMSRRISGGAYVGTVVQIDSDRSVKPVTFQPITLATPDPYEAEVEFTYYLNPFANRWPDLVNKIFQKSASRDLKIARAVRSDPTETGQAYLDAHPDPFVQYRQVFSQLLPGKSLEPIDPKNPREFHYRIGDSGPFPFSSLSSGEQEVVKVAFDLIWKQLRHSVILIDEPELHLHPALSFRLIETLKVLDGGTNQLVLFTHSTDLISTYYATGNVFFIDSDTTLPNQGRRLSELHDGHTAAARAVGANLGLFAVGKKLIFVEGTQASVDRLTYHRIAQECFPEAYLLPMGSVKNIGALREVSEELGRAIFGVDLFMLRDRDGLTDEQVAALEANPRFRVLPRRHVENFFLDAEVLAMVAKHFFLPDDKTAVSAIEQALFEAATASLNGAILLDIKHLLEMDGAIEIPKFKGAQDLSLEDLQARISRELGAAVSALGARYSLDEIEKLVRNRQTHLSVALRDGSWTEKFPGKSVLGRFVGQFWGLDVAAVRQAFVEAALQKKPESLKPIRDILEGFGRVT